LVSTAVILAGGFGTRLAPVTNFKHKSLVSVGNIAILELQINQLLKLGISRVLILTGHLGNQIEKFVSTKFSEKNIIVLNSEPSYSTRERLLTFRSHIGDEFLLLYCDNYIDDQELIRNLIEIESPGVFLLNKRKVGNVEVVENSKIRIHDVIRSVQYSFVELGYAKIESSEFFEILSQSNSLTEGYDKFTHQNECKYLIQKKEYVSLSSIDNYKKLKTKYSTLLLDRDGIINYKMPDREYVSNYNEFKYIDSNIQALRKLALDGFKFIIITNQPGVALGSVSKTFLQELHEKIVYDLLLLGIDIIAIYSCIHHWNENCECRKPKPGMLLEAMKTFDLAASETCYIGDEEKDCLAAEAAGIEPVIISNSLELNCLKFNTLFDALPYLQNKLRNLNNKDIKRN
jgi:histidinol-phosphate phosphatase family protein